MIDGRSVDRLNNNLSDLSFSDRLGSLKISEFLWIVGLNLLIFQIPLQSVLSLAGYFDELATLCLVIAAISAFIQSKGKLEQLSQFGRLTLVCLGLLVIVGMLGNYFFRIQTDARSILIDIYACIKFVIAFLSGSVAFKDAERVYVALVGEVKLLL